MSKKTSFTDTHIHNVILKCSKHKSNRITDGKVQQCGACQLKSREAMVLASTKRLPCTICGQAPVKEVQKYNGALVGSCGKMAHKADSKSRQEFKKFKKKVKAAERVEARTGKKMVVRA